MYSEALDQYFKLTRNIALTRAYVAWLKRQEDKLQNQIVVVEKNNEELARLKQQAMIVTQMERRVLAQVGLTSGMRVLDLACGLRWLLRSGLC